MKKFLGGRSIAVVMAATGLLTTLAEATEVRLSTGETLSGVITHDDGEQLVLQHVALGRVEIPADHVLAVDDEVRLAAMQETPALAPAAPPPPKSEWKSNFVLGAGGSSGNSDDQAVTLALTTNRTTDDMRTTVNLSYRWAASDGDRTANRFTALGLNDWLLPGSPWLYFASGRLDIDEFQSWDERLALHGGVGYQLYDTEKFELVLRAGLGTLKEWGSTNDDWMLEALLGGDLVWRISDTQVFTAGSLIYPSLSDSGYRTFSYADWSALMDAASNMSLTARVEHEYQSEVDPGFDKNDFRFTVGLQLDF